MIKIATVGVYVDDQSKALAFYTDVLGFQKKVDVPVGVDRFLTVVSRADPDGVQLLLEPNGNPISKAYQQGLLDAQIPAMTFATDDIQSEYARLTERGVAFTAPPARQGPVTMATFNDTCDNLILLAQVDG